MVKLKFVEVGVDAEVFDGERSLPGAAAARFELADLADRMGYAPSEIKSEDVLAMGSLILGRLAESLTWADEPWRECKIKGSSVVAVMGPGTVDALSWAVLMEQFKQISDLYGHKGRHMALGETWERARSRWFPDAASSQSMAKATRALK